MTFVDFYVGLERARTHDAKVALIEQYVRGCSTEELDGMVDCLLGASRRRVTNDRLAELAREVVDLDEPLWEECVRATGSVAETAALVCHGLGRLSFGDLANAGGDLPTLWKRAGCDDCYVLNRFALGTIRLAGSQRFLVPGISRALGLCEEAVALGLSKRPPAIDWVRGSAVGPPTRSFAPMTRFAGKLETLGPRGKWLVVGVPPGDRCRAVVDERDIALLSDSGAHPKVDEPARDALLRLGKGTVLDGLICGGRFTAIDAWALGGVEVAHEPLARRFEQMAVLMEGTGVDLAVPFGADWRDLPTHESLLLRRLDSPYPPEIDAHRWRFKPPAVRLLRGVLMYAHRGQDRGFESLTIGLRIPDGVSSIGKVLPELRRAERDELEEWIRANTLERVGPVRTVPAHQILEFSYDAVVPSKRHKCGYVVHGIKLIAWRRDLALEDIDSLERLSEPPKS